jgi:aminoglycoside N3'-acetyltransferase
MKLFEQNEIEHDLKMLGISLGDTVYVKVDLLKLGLIKDNIKWGFLDALLNIVGSEGTIITAAYTKTHFFPFIKKRKKLFEAKTIPNTGAFSKLMLKHPKAERSTHPTNSYVAIGKYARHLLDSHDHNASSYEPLRGVMNLGGKCIIVGCVDSSPGHTTTHLAQYDLGFASQNHFYGLVGATYMDSGVLKTFLRKDFGGHNIGARKVYSYYLDRGLLSTGIVGGTTGVLSPAKEAYETDLEIVRNDKKFLLCTDPTCFSCRVAWKYNRKDIVIYIASKVISKFGKFKK